MRDVAPRGKPDALCGAVLHRALYTQPSPSKMD